MPKVTLSEAIRLSGISRSSFYRKYLSQGLISVINEGDKKLIDTAELIRVFGELKGNSPKEQPGIEEKTEKDEIIELLKQQIEELKTKDKEAKEREEWFKKQLEELKEQNKQLEYKKRKKFLGIF